MGNKTVFFFIKKTEAFGPSHPVLTKHEALRGVTRRRTPRAQLPAGEAAQARPGFSALLQAKPFPRISEASAPRSPPGAREPPVRRSGSRGREGGVRRRGAAMLAAPPAACPHGRPLAPQRPPGLSARGRPRPGTRGRASGPVCGTASASAALCSPRAPRRRAQRRRNAAISRRGARHAPPAAKWPRGRLGRPGEPGLREPSSGERTASGREPRLRGNKA